RFPPAIAAGSGRRPARVAPTAGRAGSPAPMRSSSSAGARGAATGGSPSRVPTGSRRSGARAEAAYPNSSRSAVRRSATRAVTAASSVSSGAVADAIAAKPSDQRHGAGRDGRQRRQVALLGDAREHASHGVARRRQFGPVLVRTDPNRQQKMSPRERGVCFYAVFSRLARGGRSISSRRRGPLVWVKQAETAPTDGSRPGP